MPPTVYFKGGRRGGVEIGFKLFDFYVQALLWMTFFRSTLMHIPDVISSNSIKNQRKLTPG